MSVNLEEVKGLLDNLGKDWKNEFVPVVERQETEIKKYGKELAETKSQLEKINEALSDLEAKAKTAYQEGERRSDEEKQLEIKARAFKKAMFTRHGESGLDDVELKALRSDSDPDGGYLVNENFSNMITEKVYQTSPIMSVAEVITISSGDSFKLPVENADFSDGGIIGQTGTLSETAAGTISEVRIPVYEYYAQPYVTQVMLEDAAINVEAYVARKIADKISRTFNTDAVSGTSASEPQGFLTGIASGSVMNSGSTTLFDADDLIRMQYNLKGAYAANATWAWNRKTTGFIRQFKAGDDNYLWQPGIAGSVPATVLGLPYVEMEDLAAPSASDVFTQNDQPVVLADWNRFYCVVRRLGMSLQKDIYTAKPYVAYYFRMRIGGARKLDEAAKVLKITT